MFDIERVDDGKLQLRGRFDASRERAAKRVLDRVEGSCTLDCQELTYISSAGLGVLVALQLRLSKHGEELKLVNLNPHIRELFKLSGLDTVILIE